MSSRLTPEQLRRAWWIALGATALLLGAIFSTRVYTFIPGAVLSGRGAWVWIILASLMFLGGLYRSHALKRANFATPRLSVLLVGSILFAWMLKEALLGAVMLANIGLESGRHSVCMKVIDNSVSPDPYFRARTNILEACLANEQTAKLIEYRRTQTDFGDLTEGELAGVRVAEGPFGYRVIRRDDSVCRKPVNIKCGPE